ncbi:glycyl-tRNA synthetase 1 [Moelleriella libera RCEF 2490]|uniref:Glycyl-tRNA synthetase 1 n=1 Tax=Moelleriella libera RCEF 2490 TaxID=1081109 RepID=A0A167WR66_9HYPO|nr:glycyl-tRNA synthetase 1 [Moelleriella libera RCEF 2490]
MELDCTAVTSEAVLKTSGHVDRFAGWMCKDPAKGEYLHADHLIKSVIATKLAENKSFSDLQPSKAGHLDAPTVGEYEEILAKVASVS